MAIASVENNIFQAPGGKEIRYETAAEHGTLDKDDFMKLFVTQLQYQDPMAPMESAGMASQVAQFNMVDLMYKNNDAMEDMVKAENSRTSMSAVSMIGHKVRYEGNNLPVTEEGPEKLSIGLDEAAAECNVTIKDSDGNVVASWDKGFLAAGRSSLDWDGTDMNGDTVPPGDYTVYVRAVNDNGEDLKATLWTTGVVSGVTYRDDGLPELAIDNGPGITIAQVWMVED
jgi:flagellar basal-body rod modification protein FlgD